MFKTKLLQVMSEIGKGEYKSPFTNLICSFPFKEDEELLEQVTYVTDVTTSPDFGMVPDIKEGYGFILRGRNNSVHITNADFKKGTCTCVLNEVKTYDAEVECYGGFMSVLACGEVVTIVPIIS